MRKKPAPQLPNPESDDYDKSRSQKKRESLAMQQLGERLAAMAENGPGRATLKALLAEGMIDKDLHEALMELHSIKTHEAKRRHMQYIGKVMRSLEPESLLDIARSI